MIDSPTALQQHLAAIVEGSDDAIITKNLDSIIQSWNGGAERLFGYTAEEAIGRPITMLIPEDRQSEEDDIIARLRRGERLSHFETIRVRKDGSLVPISLTVSPVRDADGRVVAASKIARDITLQREAETQQRVLLSEMRHRVANAFAVASGLIAVCARQAQTPDELVTLMRDRFRALSGAHAMAVRAPGAEPAPADGTTLEDLVGSILRPFAGGAEPELSLGRVPVTGAAITPLALVIYEMCTNSVKYGALSQPEGRLSIRSEVTDGRLRIHWREACAVAEPASNREGFGTKMSRSTLASYLDGTFERQITAEGMSAVLDLSLALVTGTPESTIAAK